MYETFLTGFILMIGRRHSQYRLTSPARRAVRRRGRRCIPELWAPPKNENHPNGALSLDFSNPQNP